MCKYNTSQHTISVGKCTLEVRTSCESVMGHSFPLYRLSRQLSAILYSRYHNKQRTCGTPHIGQFLCQLCHLGLLQRAGMASQMQADFLFKFKMLWLLHICSLHLPQGLMQLTLSGTRDPYIPLALLGSDFKVKHCFACAPLQLRHLS